MIMADDKEHSVKNLGGYARICDCRHRRQVDYDVIKNTLQIFRHLGHSFRTLQLLRIRRDTSCYYKAKLLLVTFTYFNNIHLVERFRRGKDIGKT